MAPCTACNGQNQQRWTTGRQNARTSTTKVSFCTIIWTKGVIGHCVAESSSASKGAQTLLFTLHRDICNICSSRFMTLEWLPWLCAGVFYVSCITLWVYFKYIAHTSIWLYVAQQHSKKVNFLQNERDLAMVCHTPPLNKIVPYYVSAWLGINLESFRGHGTC